MMSAPRRLPPASWLLTFEEVARQHSFSRAARALGTTQPAVSQRIMQLEAALGTGLFRRLPRGVTLTPAGVALLAALSQGLDLIEAAIEALRRDGRPERLTVVTDFGFAAFWLMPRLAALRTAVAGLDVRVLTTQAEIDPRDEAVDLAIAFGDGAWPGCDADLLFPEIVLPVAAPGLLLTAGAAAAALAGVPLIHLEGGQGRWLDWTGWLAAADATLPEAGRGLRLDNYILVIHAALAGHGIALGWRPLVDDLLAEGRLVAALDREVRSPARGYFMVRPKGQPPSRPVRQFLSWMRRELSPPARSGSPPGSRAAPAAGSA
ncbi:MAG: LysR substrate-binding domain-containing protein [Geminicoccaceae bacterium]